MTECSFEILIQLLDRQLGTIQALTVFDHLDRCRICREAVRQLSRDRQQASSSRRIYNALGQGSHPNRRAPRATASGA